MTPYPTIRTLLAGLMAALAFALAALPGVAHAGTSIPPTSCASQPLTQTFARTGDTYWYFAVPGGNFDGSFAWTSGSGIGVTSAAPSGYGSAAALSLAAGRASTSPQFCVDASMPHARLMADAGGTGSLRVEAIRANGSVVALGTLSSASHASWRASGFLSLAPLGMTAGTTQLIRLRLTAVSTSWLADAVSVDPYRR